MHAIVSKEEFDEKVLKNALPVLVDFYTEWCGPCRMLAPILDQVETVKKDQVFFCKLDGDKFPEILSEYNVSAFPTLLFFKEGQVVSQKLGVSSKDAISSWLDSHLS